MVTLEIDWLIAYSCAQFVHYMRSNTLSSRNLNIHHNNFLGVQLLFSLWPGNWATVRPLPHCCDQSIARAHTLTSCDAAGMSRALQPSCSIAHVSNGLLGISYWSNVYSVGRRAHYRPHPRRTTSASNERKRKKAKKIYWNAYKRWQWTSKANIQQHKVMHFICSRVFDTFPIAKKSSEQKKKQKTKIRRSTIAVYAQSGNYCAWTKCTRPQWPLTISRCSGPRRTYRPHRTWSRLTFCHATGAKQARAPAAAHSAPIELFCARSGPRLSNGKWGVIDASMHSGRFQKIKIKLKWAQQKQHPRALCVAAVVEVVVVVLGGNTLFNPSKLAWQRAGRDCLVGQSVCIIILTWQCPIRITENRADIGKIVSRRFCCKYIITTSNLSSIYIQIGSASICSRITLCTQISAAKPKAGQTQMIQQQQQQQRNQEKSVDRTTKQMCIFVGLHMFRG